MQPNCYLLRMATKLIHATNLNLSVLADLVAHHAANLSKIEGSVVMPNEIPRAQFAACMNHVRRCVKAGLLIPSKTHLVLTSAGLGAVMGTLATEIKLGEKRGFGEGVTEAMYKRNHEARIAALAWLKEHA